LTDEFRATTSPLSDCPNEATCCCTEVRLHLDPGHKVLWVVEAPSAEVVRDFVYDSGLSRWNDFEFYMASSHDEISSWTEGCPPSGGWGQLAVIFTS